MRLAAPDGSATTGPVDRGGLWSLATPAGPAPRLYSLSETIGGRLLRARGYVAFLPAPGPAAALLRPAAGAVLPPAVASREISAVDYDGSGAATVSGRARAGEGLRLLLDGKDAGEDRADASGAFDAALSRRLTPGPHVLVLVGLHAKGSARFTAPRSTQLATPLFAAARLEEGWRIDWTTPGGGVQSTILFDQPGGRP